MPCTYTRVCASSRQRETSSRESDLSNITAPYSTQPCGQAVADTRYRQSSRAACCFLWALPPTHGNDGIVARACRARSGHACRARIRAFARVLASARHRVAKATYRTSLPLIVPNRAAKRSPTHGTDKVLGRRVAFAGVTSDAVPSHGNDNIVARACRARSGHAYRARKRAFARVLASARHRVAKAT